MPISTITNNPRRTPFSLIELVVTMAIAATVIAVGAVAFRPEPPAARRADQLGRELLTWLARVRTRAMSAGDDCRVILRTAERRLESAPAESSGGNPGEEPSAEEKPLSFPLSEGMEIDVSELETVGDEVEILRFFADGSASGVLKLTIRIGTAERVLEVSGLTGLLRLGEPVKP